MDEENICITYHEICMHECDATKYLYRNWSFAIIFCNWDGLLWSSSLRSGDQQPALNKKNWPWLRGSYVSTCGVSSHSAGMLILWTPKYDYCVFTVSWTWALRGSCCYSCQKPRAPRSSSVADKHGSSPKMARFSKHDLETEFKGGAERQRRGWGSCRRLFSSFKIWGKGVLLFGSEPII